MHATNASENRKKSTRTTNVRADTKTFENIKKIGYRYRLSNAVALEAIIEHFASMSEDEQMQALFKKRDHAPVPTE